MAILPVPQAVGAIPAVARREATRVGRQAVQAARLAVAGVAEAAIRGDGKLAEIMTQEYAFFGNRVAPKRISVKKSSVSVSKICLVWIKISD